MEQKFFTMSRQSRDEYLRQKSREYAKQCGPRAARSAFIDEVERTTALARKTLIRRLNHPPSDPPAGTPRKRRRRYDERDVSLLKRVWRESGFLCGKLLCGVAKEIPQRALRASACPKPGHIGADTVALCGGNMGGKFFWILTLTDVFSGFTLIAPIWNKESGAISAAIVRLLG